MRFPIDTLRFPLVELKFVKRRMLVEFEVKLSPSAVKDRFTEELGDIVRVPAPPVVLLL